MLPSLRLVLQFIVSITAHQAVCRAIAKPTQIKRLVKQLTDIRMTSLAMVSPSVYFAS
jgi:hypothetical protein